MHIRALAEDIHQTNRDKGFWDKERNMGEARFLIISELSEAIEAHRNGMVANLKAFSFHEKHNINDYVVNFKTFIKDTPADELADAAIRILDLVEGTFDEEEKSMFYIFCEENNRTLSGIENFGEALLKIACYITRSYDDKMSIARYLHLAFSGLKTLAAEIDIDLFEHMDLKLRYNKTRARLHGKAY